MELNLKTSEKETELLFSIFKMNIDRGFNGEQTKAEIINQIMNAAMPLLNRQPQSTVFIPPGVEMESMLPTDEQLKMMTNDETAFRKAIDARDTLKRMIHPIYHM